jgi:hypothetical protein
VDDVRAVAATLERSGGNAQRETQFTTLRERLQASKDPIHHKMARLMTRFQPGLFAGGEALDLPPDNLDLERWFRQPKSHARRIHGRQHAGVRLVQEGPTLVLALDAHLQHPNPYTAAELRPYRDAPMPLCQEQARVSYQRRTCRRCDDSRVQHGSTRWGDIWPADMSFSADALNLVKTAPVPLLHCPKDRLPVDLAAKPERRPRCRAVTEASPGTG